VETELNAVTDNPVVFAEDGHCLHGGNFFGQHVAFASDALVNAVAMLAVQAERAIARLCDPVRNRDLPAFLTGGQAGLDAGFMGAQVTASALLAEIRSLATPASIQSIPTNADNQDIVPMGTIAARKAGQCLDLTSRILAIHLMCLAQSVDLLAVADAISPESSRLYAGIRARVPYLDEDRSLAADIEGLADELTALTTEPGRHGVCPLVH
jgi:tyrosine ammonia-lyase